MCLPAQLNSPPRILTMNVNVGTRAEFLAMCECIAAGKTAIQAIQSMVDARTGHTITVNHVSPDITIGKDDIALIEGRIPPWVPASKRIGPAMEAGPFKLVHNACAYRLYVVWSGTTSFDDGRMIHVFPRRFLDAAKEWIGKIQGWKVVPANRAAFGALCDEEGECLVSGATKDLRERVYTINWKYACWNPGCESSGRKTKKCGQCKVARYCKEECQREDWREHKKWCKGPALL